MNPRLSLPGSLPGLSPSKAPASVPAASGLPAIAPQAPSPRPGDVKSTPEPTGRPTALGLPSSRESLRGLNAYGGSNAYLKVSSLGEISPDRAEINPARSTTESRLSNLEHFALVRQNGRALDELVEVSKQIVPISQQLQPDLLNWKSNAPSEQVQAFDRIHGMLAGDPIAQVAFESLLVSGRLTDSRPSATEQSLLETLADASTRKAQEPLQMPVILADVVQELADPASINQAARGTCAAGAVQNAMASTDPAEYARIVTGLASEEGVVTLRNGTEMRREAEGELLDNSGRTDSSRLFQDVALQLSVEKPEHDFRNPRMMSDDPRSGLKIHLPDGRSLPTSADAHLAKPEGAAKVLSAMTGLRYHAYVSTNFDHLENALQKGQPIWIGLDSSRPGQERHAISLVAMDRADPANPQFVALNSWGQSHRFTRADLVKAATAIVAPEP